MLKNPGRSRGKGLRLGSRAFPKMSAAVFTVFDEKALSALRAGVDEFCTTCGEQLKMHAWDVREV